VGSLDVGPGQALFAHELTHIAQRARFGPDLPLEHTPAGKALEAEALSAEMALAPAAAPVSPVRTTPLEPATRPGEEPPPGVDVGPPPAAGPLPLPLATPLAPVTSPGPDQATIATILEQLSALKMSAPVPGGGGSTPVMSPAPMSTPPPAAAAAGAAIQRAPNETTQTDQHSTGGAQPNPFAERPDDADLSRLARWLYPILSYQLRAELREGRERSGLLTDNYGRW
jgi:syndecan 1